MKQLPTLTVSAAALLVAAACSSAGSSPQVAAGSSPSASVTVFAASSLTPAFTTIAAGFEAANAIAVTFNFGSSTDLAALIQSEGTADVFASASGMAMDTVEGDPGVSGRTDFVSNRLVIVTPPDDPAGISSIDDLAGGSVQLVLGAEGVPVGDYARQALKHAGILGAALANVVSNEEDDASVVAKVAAGEADAAIVYASDVAAVATTDLRSVDIPDDENVVATYPIAIVVGSTNEDAARAFVGYVTGADGQATLREFGFSPPVAT
jgi:molybdate transport system substrate-binding protein